MVMCWKSQCDMRVMERLGTSVWCVWYESKTTASSLFSGCIWIQRWYCCCRSPCVHGMTQITIFQWYSFKICQPWWKRPLIGHLQPRENFKPKDKVILGGHDNPIKICLCRKLNALFVCEFCLAQKYTMPLFLFYKSDVFLWGRI